MSLSRFVRELFYRAPTAAENTSGKFFDRDLREFNAKIEANENFALVRFGDGEMAIINGHEADLSQKYNGEHKYSPGESKHEQQRQRLHHSLTFNNDNYFVGIACPCCVGKANFQRLKADSNQPERRLTWANIFVNSNYRIFKTETVAALQGRTINIVCHHRAVPERLPFPVNKVFTTGANAWVADYDRVHSELIDYLRDDSVNDEVFIFCAGVLTNILIVEIMERFPQNTYIDLGSVFDDVMGLGKTRKYLKNGRNLRKTCVWQ